MSNPFRLDDLVDLGCGLGREQIPGEELYRFDTWGIATRWMPESLLLARIAKHDWDLSLTISSMVVERPRTKASIRLRALRHGFF